MLRPLAHSPHSLVSRLSHLHCSIWKWSLRCKKHAIGISRCQNKLLFRVVIVTCFWWVVFIFCPLGLADMNVSARVNVIAVCGMIPLRTSCLRRWRSSKGRAVTIICERLVICKRWGRWVGCRPVTLTQDFRVIRIRLGVLENKEKFSKQTYYIKKNLLNPQ